MKRKGALGLLLGTVRRPTARAPEPGRQKKADAAHAGQGVRDCSWALGLAVPSVRVGPGARHKGVPLDGGEPKLMYSICAISGGHGAQVCGCFEYLSTALHGYNNALMRQKH